MSEAMSEEIECPSDIRGAPSCIPIDEKMAEEYSRVYDQGCFMVLVVAGKP